MGRYVLGIDFETSGLSPVDDRITEIGAVLFDWGTKVPLQLMSCFVHCDKPLSEEIVKLTGITDQMLEDFGRSEEDALADLDYLLRCADYAMAHNGNLFDLRFYIETCKRLGKEVAATLWIDSKTDVKYPESITTRNLCHLAAEHSFLNPFRHRAVFDVLTMLNVASNYDLDAIIARAQEPLLYIRAVVSYDDREKAKERGFHWYAPTKIWWKDAKQSDFLSEKDSYGFPTTLLERAPE